MIRVVISYKQDLTKDCLPCPVRNLREQVGRRIPSERLYLLEFFEERLDTAVPMGLVEWYILLRPVLVRPLGGFVIRIQGESKDVPLRNPQVLKKLPRGVTDSYRFAPSVLPVEFADDRRDRHIRLPSFQLRKKLVPQDLIPHKPSLIDVCQSVFDARHASHPSQE